MVLGELIFSSSASSAMEPGIDGSRGVVASECNASLRGVPSEAMVTFSEVSDEKQSL